MEMMWNEAKWKDMRWDDLSELKLYYWDVSRFFQFPFIYCHLHLTSTHFFHVVPLSSICYRFHAVRSTFHFPHCSCFHFFSILFISFPFEYICLLYFQFSSSLQMIKPSRMVREIKQNYGPQSILIIWIVSLSMILTKFIVIRILYTTDMCFSVHKKLPYDWSL
jgi:hypothetical protein